MPMLEKRIEEGTRRLLEEAGGSPEFAAAPRMGYNRPSKGA